MTNMLADAAAWVADEQENSCANPVTYWRGSISVAIDAVIGQTAWEVQDEDGILTRVVSRDFLIRVEDLLHSGSLIEPARGDLIKEVVAGTTYTHEVLAPGNAPVFAMDPFRIRYRIHTKQVKT